MVILQSLFACYLPSDPEHEDRREEVGDLLQLLLEYEPAQSLNRDHLRLGVALQSDPGEKKKMIVRRDAIFMRRAKMRIVGLLIALRGLRFPGSEMEVI